jgi:RHS repeat-associated protein
LWVILLKVASYAYVVSAAVVWSYEYRTTDVHDPHQLTASVDPNGHRVDYEYFLPSEPFPGETPSFLVLDKNEYVKKVHEHAGDSDPDTEFQFDVSDAIHLHWKTRVKDARHNETRYVLNGNGSPLEIHEPLGKTTLLEWSDSDIFKTKETDANLRVTTYGYDGNGNLSRETILNSDQTTAAETTYAYDATFNKMTHKQDAEKRETSWGIDARGDVVSEQDAVGNLKQYEYDDGQPDGPGLLTKATDPRGHATLHSGHDSFGHPTLTTDAVGNAFHSSYDTRGRLVEEQDSFGRHHTVEYDGLDRVRTDTHFSGGPSGDENAVVQRRYFPGGERKQEENANGAVTTYTLDGLNRVTGTVTEGSGFAALSTAATYDGNGNKLTETDRRGVTQQHVYDPLNRLSETRILSGVLGEGPLGTVATYGYDAVANKTSETDVSGNETDYEYDTLYHVTKKLLPESGASGRYFEAYTYDRVGNKLTSQDANGKVTQYGYDGLSRVQTMVRDLGGLSLTSGAEYDDPEGSHVNKSADVDEARGLRTEYGYDPLGRELERKQLLLKDGSGDPVSPNDAVAYVTATSYDDAAHAITVVDPDLHVTRVVMDGLDRAVEHTVDPGGLNLITQTTYDGLGGKNKVTDPRQHDTAFETDGLGRTTRITDANQQDTVVEYDGEGLKTSETDRRGVRRDFTHDNLSRPRKTTLVPSITGVAWSQETQYLDATRQRKEIDARLTPTTFDLDKLGRVVKETDTYGKSVQTTWDGVNKRQVRDKRGNVTVLDYDGLNRLTVTTDPLVAGQSAPYVLHTDYLDSQNRSVETDRRGTIKTTQMDPLGRAVSVTRDGTLLERNSYDGVGNKVLAEDADGTKTSFEYDPANRLQSQVAGFGSSPQSTTTFKHDENGNVEEERDQRAIDLGLPYAVKRTFDALNRVSTELDSDGRTTTHSYDEEGNRTLLREPNLQETAYVYDELGKLIQVDETAVPGGVPETVYTYDPDRNRTRQEDSNHNLVEMSYDLLNRLDLMTQKGAPEGDLVTDHDYDENGNETKLTDPKGQTVTNTYDELNRLKTKAYAFAPDDPYRPWRHTVSVAYSHDPNSNLIRQDESVASGTDPPSETVTIERTFDTLDRLQTETETLPGAGPKTLTYTYWPNGLRKTLTDPESGLTSYTYDSQNRLETVTTSLGTTSYTYYGDGLLHEVTEPDGSKATHTYDNADRLLSVVHTQGPTTLASYSYTYDDNGNRLTQVETNGTAEATAYTYDDLNRLETVTYPADATFPEGRKVEYGYDLVGNRTSEITKNPQTDAVLASKTGTFDALNRLTELTDNLDPSQTLTLGWDKDGNQTSKQVGAGTPTYYRYDVKDKTVEVQDGTGPILVRYQHDAEGRLLKKIGEDGIRLYVHDQTARLSEYADTGLRVARYTYGSDRLISLQHQTEGTRFYHLDGLGSVSTLTDAAGSVVSRLHADAFGTLRFPTEMNASANRFAFTGYTFEREVGLYDAKARLYDPETARFTTQDSFLGKIDAPPSLHRYFYANDNPTRYVDRTGRNPVLAYATLVAVGTAEGALFGAGLDLLHQMVAVADGAQTGFDWQQLRRSAKWGGLAGGTIVGSGPMAPATATVWAGVGAKTAYDQVRQEWSEGHRWTASFDATATVVTLGLGARALARGPRTVVEGRTGPVLQPSITTTAGPESISTSADTSSGGSISPSSTTTTVLDHFDSGSASSDGVAPQVDTAPVSISPPDPVSGPPQRRAGSVRNQDYPQRVRTGTTERLEAGARDPGGVIRCQGADCAQPGGRVLQPGQGTPQHVPPLVETHNEAGWNTDQPTRNNLFNDTAEELHCIECQKKEGGQTRQTYRRDTGPDYKPKPKRNQDEAGP